VLGGLYSTNDDTFYGPQLESALRDMHVDVLFFGVDGLSLEHGLTTDNIIEARLGNMLANTAQRVIAVTDSSKLGVAQLQSYLGLDRVYMLLTDHEASPAFVASLTDRGVVVLQAACPNSPVDAVRS
jgi:DeoR/GlpR family transcriptional regulator of sugar metabolism